MLDLKDIDRNTAAIAAAGPLGILSDLVCCSMRSRDWQSYQPPSLLIVLQVDGRVQLIYFIVLPPLFCLFKLLQGIRCNETTGPEKPSRFNVNLSPPPKLTETYNKVASS
jgi:hypothetical protein